MTTQNIATFNFQSKEVRTVVIDDTMWFVAADVCAALNIKNVTQALQSLDDDERSMLNIGRQGEANIISESGMYCLVLRSRNATTQGTNQHAFRKWVTSEVLPTIRKTGSYTLTINPQQQRAIQEAINDSVHRVAGRTHQGMYSAIKSRYGIAKYDQLPASKFDDCIAWLNEGYLKPKVLEMTPQLNKILYELCYYAFVTSYDYAKLLRILRPINETNFEYDMRNPHQCTKQIQTLLEHVQIRNVCNDPLFGNGMINFFNGGGMGLSKTMFG